MIKNNTVFILGAGTSCPYGVFSGDGSRVARHYPTGRELYNYVRDVDSHHLSYVPEAFGSLDEFFRNYGMDFHKYVKEFVASIRRADVGSIDFFINENRKYADLGKVLIARRLIECEDEKGLYCDAADNWYRYLVELIKAPKYEEVFNNNVAFVTFNYDRSLEQYLYHHFESLYTGKTKEEILKLFSHFKIVHLYGDIGKLPFQEDDGFKYSSTDRIVDRYRSCINTIHLIGEERTRKEFDILNGMLKDAQSVYFLGFGFDQVNISRINLELLRGKNVYYTGLGLPDSKNRAIYDLFVNKGIPVQDNAYDRNQYNAADYLKKYFPVNILSN